MTRKKVSARAKRIQLERARALAAAERYRRQKTRSGAAKKAAATRKRNRVALQHEVARQVAKQVEALEKHYQDRFRELEARAKAEATRANGLDRAMQEEIIRRRLHDANRVGMFDTTARALADEFGFQIREIYTLWFSP